jgi:hypothetical protein
MYYIQVGTRGGSKDVSRPRLPVTIVHPSKSKYSGIKV